MDDVVLEARDGARAAGALPALAGGRAPRQGPTSSTTSIEQLFHEKSVTGRGAWKPAVRRDAGLAPLQGARRRAGARADPQQAAGHGRHPAPRRGGRAGRGVQGEPAAVHAHHQHARQRQGDLRPLARLRGRGGFAPSRQTASSARWWTRWWRRWTAAYPRLSHRYYALKAKWFGRSELDFWDRNAAPAQGGAAPDPVETRPAIPCSPRMASLPPRWRLSPSASSTATGSTRRLRPGKAPGAFAHPTVPSAHPYVLLNYQGQAAGRDDARARARPRRAPGAGRARTAP